MDGVTLALWVLVATAALTSVYVVPQVMADTFEAATPRRALPALQGMAVFDASMAAGLALFRSRLSQQGALRFAALALLALAMLLQGLAYADASMAYLGHGPDMQGVVWVMGTLALALVVSATKLARAIWEAPGGREGR